MTVRRYVASACVALSVVATYDVAHAQVGHDPATSPYRDIPLRPAPVVFIGHLSGDRGIAGAGVSSAVTIGARYEIPAGRSLQFQLTTAYLHGDRFILDPGEDSTSPARRTGPVTSNLALAEVGLQLRLTGAKSWHGIAPYIGTAAGFVFDVDSPGDTTGSGYRFGTKFAIAGSTGARWYPTRHLMVNVDVRAQLWRLHYPVSFHAEAPGDKSRIVPVDRSLNDWTIHPWISLGIGWTF